MVADSGNNRIRKISSRGRITTVAGTGSGDFSGDGGPAVDAELALPTGVAVTAAGGFLIADTANNRIRRVAPNGRIITVAGIGTAGFSGDGGPATSAELFSPTNVAATARGGFLIADNGNRRVRRVSGAGVITTVAGTGRPGFSGDGGPAVAADLDAPTGVAATPGGGFLVADSGTNRIRRVAEDGTITTVAGTGVKGSSGDLGPATEAQLAEPTNVSLRGGGFLIADTGNQAVRRVSAAGRIATVAGTGIAGFSGDGGPAAEADLTGPTAAVAARHAVLIADNGNGRIRRVSSRGEIATVAGSGVSSEASGFLTPITPAFPGPKLKGDTKSGAFISVHQRSHRPLVVKYTAYTAARASIRVLRRGRRLRRETEHADFGPNHLRFRRLQRHRQYKAKLFIGSGPADQKKTFKIRK